MVLETERLILRPWCEADAQDLFLYAKDPDVGPSAGWLPHTSEEHSLEILRTVLMKPTVFAVCRKDGHPIGNIHLDFASALCRRDDECELGYWLGKPHWGQGIIPEAARTLLAYAFETLKVYGIWCGCYADNQKSRRVQKKLGFADHHTDVVPDPRKAGQTRTVYRTYLAQNEWKKQHHCF